MAKPSRILGARQRRQNRQIDDGSFIDGINADEKKESPSWMHTDSKLWQDKSFAESDFNPTMIHANDVVESQSPAAVTGPDVEDIRRNASSTNNGLHHRHHFQPQQPNSNIGRHQTSSSPNRRRITRARGNAAEHHHLHSRRRKWTAMQIFRSIFLAGAALYFLVMFHGTQMLMQQKDTNDEDQGTSRFSDYFPLPAGYVPHKAMQGYLRSGETTIESLAPFIHKATDDSPDDVRQAVKQRVSERWKRTRPPARQPHTSSIIDHGIVPAERRPVQQSVGRQSPSSAEALTLAEESMLCGEHARQARESNPEAFLERDALLSSEAKVLITGIVSNPLAFHLALALKQRCGVETFVGIDPLLPNTIANRMQHVEQMQILASNAPKMQPILVPLIGLDPRVKKSKKESPAENPIMLDVTGELNLLNFEPTHIVHLSGATYQNPVSVNVPQSPIAPKRLPTPYQTSKDDAYDPSLFHMRSNMMAMEQILASIVSNLEDEESVPHMTYASASMRKSASLANEDVVLSYSKLADEVLADTYHALFGAYSIGLRLPSNALYGPWDTETSLHHLLHEAINGNFTVPGRDSGKQELLYVQDAVEAIISAMQYRERSATHFDLNGKSAISLSNVPSLAESLLTSKSKHTLEEQPLHDEQTDRTWQKLKWKPETSIREGILKSLAWLIDRASPYGPPPARGDAAILPSPGSPQQGTGDALLLANSVPTCAANDLACHSSPRYLPCASECSIHAQCQASIFDSVQQLSREMTEGCDAVLYTQSLGSNVEDLQLQSQFEDDVEPAICNLAYVAQTSPLVKAVIEKIPLEELERLGVPPSALFDVKLKKLNGRLLYRGWILIWVDPGDAITLADSSLMKLSPGRMFADDVLYAVFVEENFTVSPTTDDVRFLISQMDRGATKQRSIYRMIKKDEQSKPKKMKFTIAAQPEKRASILLSQLKFKISDRGRIPQDTKISIMDAVRFMRFEIGSDPTKRRESSAIKRQKDFYRRIPTFVNGKDLRDNFEPIYKYEIKHWVRTRWAVHDLTLEESRELRCDWYQEHLQWGSEIDQLSFAAVMARRIIDRRMSLMEPDDRSKPKDSVITELKDVTDHNEWFAMATEHNKLHILQGGHTPGVEEVVGDEATDEDAADTGPDIPAGRGYNEKKPDAGLYIRVISDRFLSLSRKAYTRYRAELASAEKPPRH